MNSQPLITVIIVSYNTEDETLEAVRSVRSSHGFKKSQIEIIVVDNASKDATVAKLKSNYSDIEIIENLKNKGFGSANNQGIEKAQGKYILLLNSDAFLSADTLEILVQKLKSDPELLAIAPQLRDDEGNIQQSAGYLPRLSSLMAWMWWWDRVPFLKTFFLPFHVVDQNWYKKERNPEWLMGACILFHREDLVQSGGFDDKIFMYAEEVELFLRLKKLGKKVLFTPSTHVIHLGGLSSEKSKTGKLIKELQGIEYIYQKHYPRFLVLLHPILYIGVWLRVIMFRLLKGKKGRVDEYKKYLRVA